MPKTLHRFVVLPAALALASLSPLAASAQPGEIKGQDVKGDRDKSALDGWSQAPVPREESAAKDAPDPGGASIKKNADAPTAPPSGAPGEDPQQPMDHRTPGPSGQNPAQPSR